MMQFQENTRTDGRTDGRTYRRTDRSKDGQTPFHRTFPVIAECLKRKKILLYMLMSELLLQEKKCLAFLLGHMLWRKMML